MIKSFAVTTNFNKPNLKDVENFFGKNYSLIKEINQVEKMKYENTDGLIILVLSGGVERIVQKLIKNFKTITLLIALPHSNSLAASLEIYSYLKNNYRLNLYYSEMNSFLDLKKINEFKQIALALNKLRNSTLGLFGKPSSWLLTSDRFSYYNKFGISIKEFSMQNLIDNYFNFSKEPEKNGFNDFTKQHIKNDEIDKAFKLYSTMKDFITNEKLNAITIKCFDLLKHNVTACLALAKLNDENIISGCEADLEAVVTMMIVNYLTDELCWMANPSSIDKKENIVTFAHCTIPSKMLHFNKRFNTHMESDLSVALEGELPEQQEVTIVRFGENLEKVSIKNGVIITSDMKNYSLCRTQARIKIDGEVSEWIENTLGNHQIIIYGNYYNIISTFADFCRIDIINY